MLRLVDEGAYAARVEALYEAAFPLEERLPIEILRERAAAGAAEFLAAEDEAGFAGLAYVLPYEPLGYVFFLAVDEARRGAGVGSALLAAIRERHPACEFCLMAEDPNDPSAPNAAERLRRIGFYERNGYARMGVIIIEAGVRYELLATRPGVGEADFLDIMRTFLGREGFAFYLERYYGK